MENTSEEGSEEFTGDQPDEYIPDYMCMKRDQQEEEVCETLTSSCSEAKTSTGNILDRIIKDPTCRRPPCLTKWPGPPPRDEDDYRNNVHQYRAAQEPTTLKQMCRLKVTSDPNPYRQPAIVATIGPSSIDVHTIVELLEAGMNAGKLSMSYLNPGSVVEPIRNIIEGTKQFNTMRDFLIPIAIIMDLKGPEIRTGRFSPKVKELYPDGVVLKEHETITLTADEAYKDRCTEKNIFVDYAPLIDLVVNDMIIFIANGQVKLVVQYVENKAIICTTKNGGYVRDYQTVFVPGLPQIFDLISDYDKECLDAAVRLEMDAIFLPKIRNAESVKQVKRYLDEIQNENNLMIFAKISNYEGLSNIDEILRVADGIVLHKNDLCLEISPEKMVVAQKEIIGKCNSIGKPILCTGQLDVSEMSNEITKRIEMNDIAGTILDGADGIILSKETAADRKVIDVVVQTSNILKEAEAATMQRPYHYDLTEQLTPSIEPCNAVSLAAVQISIKIQAAAILTVTTSGKTAQLLSWFRPRCPVVAITRVGHVARKLNFWRAVIPLHYQAPLMNDWFHDVKARFDYGISYGRSCGMISAGDLLVLVSGYRKRSGFTNCIRIVFAAAEKNEYQDNLSQYFSNSTGSTQN